MGLFSVLDIILDKPMKEALTMVNVSKEITDALVDNKGEMAKVFEFIKQYEIASWSELSRQMIVYNIKEGPVYEAYTEALSWYRDLFGTVDAKK
jgi:EAL and modified HD-GYP domain-containing signal transduction protein